MKKTTFTALTVAICTAASTVSYGAVFSDIGSNLKWAESYINSVYDSGLMVGDYNSRGQRVFRGTENMTYSEAAQLIYSMTIKSGFSSDVTQMSINRYSMEMSGEGIADWATKAVAFCMEKGIVNSYDLTKFKDGGKDVKISREDMNVFFGRALALSYSLSTGTSLTFADTSSISASAKPYVELLNKLGVVTGDNYNKFNPKNNITRAEVAVMASKTYDLMKKKVVTNTESGYTQTSGTVVSLYEQNGTWVLRLTTPDGVAGFVLTDSTLVFNNASNNVGPYGLGLGDAVTVYHSDASIAKVMITKDVNVDPNQVNTPQFNSTYKDKGELISAGEYKIGIIDKHGDRVYYVVAKDADITLNGKTATLRQLSDRIKGDALVEVTVEMNSSTQEAYKVTAVEEKYSSATEGRITNINNREISIKSGSKSYKYSLADSVTVKYNGSTSSVSGLISKFDDLTGSKYIDVELTLDKDKEVTKIVAEASNYKEDDDKDYSGDIKSITSSKIKVGSKEYTVANNVKVDIKIGRDSIDDYDDLKDIFNGRDVTVKVDITVKSSEVTRIEGYVSEARGELDFMTVTNSSYPRGRMGLDVDGYGQVEFSFD
ncbi:MAG: S-layer homology domain-containing protein, partial [Clostridia bacterium]|nr:S-layer homology domain-containing protein [Clostridia bacterium]